MTDEEYELYQALFHLEALGLVDITRDENGEMLVGLAQQLDNDSPGPLAPDVTQ